MYPPFLPAEQRPESPGGKKIPPLCLLRVKSLILTPDPGYRGGCREIIASPPPLQPQPALLRSRAQQARVGGAWETWQQLGFDFILGRESSGFC